MLQAVFTLHDNGGILMDDFVMEKKENSNLWNIWYSPKGEGGYLVLSATEQELKQLSKWLREHGF